jgi:hypothetical protein
MPSIKEGQLHALAYFDKESHLLSLYEESKIVALRKSKWNGHKFMASLRQLVPLPEETVCNRADWPRGEELGKLMKDLKQMIVSELHVSEASREVVMSFDEWLDRTEESTVNVLISTFVNLYYQTA